MKITIDLTAEQFNELCKIVPPSKIMEQFINQYEIDRKLQAIIDTRDLSNRTTNCLRLNKINTYGDLLKYTCNDLLRLRNLGRGSMLEISEHLKSLGYLLREAI